MRYALLQHCIGPAVLALAIAALPATSAAQTEKFAEATAERLAELRISDSEVRSIDYKIKRNMTDKAGPPIRGARAWIRLNGCSGWLVIDMNRAAYVNQTYTRGDCRVDGVPAY
ncbi:hypothetical protein [Pelagibius sp. 7325]|uniref:hypothetical protein n=1 Tax=Pelagibius sp. 7325 TaxID=3131994 RepID=UPI0030ED61F2